MKKFQYKHSSLLSCSINDDDRKFHTATKRWSMLWSFNFNHTAKQYYTNMKKCMYKHSSLLSCSINGEDGKFYTAATRWLSTLRPKKKWMTKNTFGPSNRSTVSSHLFIKSLTALAAPTECYKLPVDYPCLSSPSSGNTKWGSITVPLISCLTGLD